MGFKCLAPILIVFSSLSALAGPINITNVTNASNRIINSDGTAKIFGGVAGTCASTNGTTTCDSCVTADLACNKTRIYDALKLRITFTVTEDFTAPLWFGRKLSGESAATKWSSYTTNYGTGNLTKNTSGYVEIAWSELCQAQGGTCDYPLNLAAMTLVIGASSSSSEPATTARVEAETVVFHPDFDVASSFAYDQVECADSSPSTGICNFVAYPGDEKIYVKDLNVIGTYPTSSIVRLTAVRIFYSTVSFAAATYTSSDYVDLSIPDDNVGTPSPGKIEGLQNDVTYFFRPAVVDEANNVAFLESVADITTVTDCLNGVDAGCDLIATPSKVYGLLTEDLNCFVSTAAFGSSLSSEVETFREFRNRFLLSSKAGRKFINAYYNFGPKAAQIIHEHPKLKTLARVALYPALWFAKLSIYLKSSVQASLLVLLSIFGISVFTILVRRGNLWQKS